MRFFLAGMAVLGVLLTGFGIFFSVGWLVLVGAAALIVAVVMRALATPATRGER